MRDFLSRWRPGGKSEAHSDAPEQSPRAGSSTRNLGEALAHLPFAVALLSPADTRFAASRRFKRLRSQLDWPAQESFGDWLARRLPKAAAALGGLTVGQSWSGKLSVAGQSHCLDIVSDGAGSFWLSVLADPDCPAAIVDESAPAPDEVPAADRIFAQAGVGIALVRDERILRVNPKFADLFLVDAQSMAGKPLLALFPDSEQGEELLNRVNDSLSAGKEFEHELYLKREGHPDFWCTLSVKPLDGDDAGLGEIWLFKDASQHKGVEDHLRQAAVVFESSSDGIIVLDARRNIRMVNSSFSRITGYSAEEVKGKNPRLLNSGKQTPEFYERLWAHVEKRGPWQGEIWNRRKSGELYPEWCSITPVRDSGGTIVEYVMIFSDITQRKQIENRLLYQASFDGLTDLPNRSLFMDRLNQGLVRAKREGTSLALLFIDLDRFKNINDTLGHSAGDKLLVAVSKELRNCVRESDTIARFGGDEFAVILSPIYGPKNAGTVAQNLLKILSSSFDIDGYETIVGGSIGITIYPTDGTNAEELVKNADAAMYRAKESGRNNYQFFTGQMQQAALARMTLERDLRYAVERNELLLNFQPQLGLRTENIEGMEVLVRWQHPVRGMVSPLEFVSLAEDTGIIVPIGEWVLRNACRQFRSWQETGVAPPRMAVNVSGRQFNSPHFVRMVRGILDETSVAPGSLELELTESILMKDEERVISTLNELRAMGLYISIDDFGTGYSSLSYLKRFPINTLKIDRSFVQDIPGDADDAAIVKAIVDMAHTLKMEVVAEGVENEEQLSFLRLLRCDYIQGYHYSRPLGIEQCAKFLALEKASLWARSHQKSKESQG